MAVLWYGDIFAGFTAKVPIPGNIANTYLATTTAGANAQSIGGSTTLTPYGTGWTTSDVFDLVYLSHIFFGLLGNLGPGVYPTPQIYTGEGLINFNA
jgi:hypothetical protein